MRTRGALFLSVLFFPWANALFSAEPLGLYRVARRSEVPPSILGEQYPKH